MRRIQSRLVPDEGEPSSQHCKKLTSLGLSALLVGSLLSCARKGGPTGSANSGNSALTTEGPPEPARKNFKSGEAVPAGYFGYKVYASWFADHLPGQLPDKQTAGAAYLYVDLSVVNTDRKERAVGQFKLIDKEDKAFLPTEKAAKIDGSVGQIGNLGSGVSKRGLAIFEVPRDGKYKLKLSGFSTDDEVTIELAPTATAPTSAKDSPRK